MLKIRRKTMFLWLTILMGSMFALTLSFTLLGRVDNIILAIFVNVVIGGQFFYYAYKLSLEKE